MIDPSDEQHKKPYWTGLVLTVGLVSGLLLVVLWIR